jgi:primosomal protein N' (replication factor Y)
MDADSTTSKDSYSSYLTDFANGKYDVMLGTQMVAKGLNFPNVTVVGVIGADSATNSSDYRSFERAFSMLTQVVGRSGRGADKGRAIIQTYTPENPIIDLSANQDYDAFYADEIEIRRAMMYPPFSDIMLIGFVGENKARTITCSNEFLVRLKELCSSDYKDLPIRALGPSAALVSKVNNKYRIIGVSCINILFIILTLVFLGWLVFSAISFNEDTTFGILFILLIFGLANCNISKGNKIIKKYLEQEFL